LPADRVLDILNRLVAGSDVEPGTDRLCVISAEMTEMSGAGIMLRPDGGNLGSLGTTDDVSGRLEELQHILGEGPCVDACDQDQPVLEPDLAHPDALRWPAFTPAALAAGARAVFGFRVRVGTVGLGSLNLYRDRPGPLTRDQHADALVLADVAARMILVSQAHAAPGAAAPEIESGAALRLVVHQASGMVAVQLGVGVADALVSLRSHAFASERSLIEVAEDVVTRRLRFGDQNGPQT
jgi:hypothetical protein